MQKAQDIANDVRALAAALLAAYEKGDAEHLASLRATHERQLLNLALEIRQPALVQYLVTVFERLWRLAIPLTAPLPDTGIEGISYRERSIAALLAEGHQDAVIAERLGISVRTCRAHIARLSETLGAASRTQLGVRIAQVGLVGPAQAADGPAQAADGLPSPAMSLPDRGSRTGR